MWILQARQVVVHAQCCLSSLDSSHMQSKTRTNHPNLIAPETGSANHLLFMLLLASMIFSPERDYPVFPVISSVPVSLPWESFHDFRPLLFGGCKKEARSFDQRSSPCSTTRSWGGEGGEKSKSKSKRRTNHPPPPPPPWLRQNRVLQIICCLSRSWLQWSSHLNEPFLHFPWLAVFLYLSHEDPFRIYVLCFFGDVRKKHAALTNDLAPVVLRLSWKCQFLLSWCRANMCSYSSGLCFGPTSVHVHRDKTITGKSDKYLPNPHPAQLLLYTL